MPLHIGLARSPPNFLFPNRESKVKPYFVTSRRCRGSEPALAPGVENWSRKERSTLNVLPLNTMATLFSRIVTEVRTVSGGFG